MDRDVSLIPGSTTRPLPGQNQSCDWYTCALGAKASPDPTRLQEEASVGRAGVHAVRLGLPLTLRRGSPKRTRKRYLDSPTGSWYHFLQLARFPLAPEEVSRSSGAFFLYAAMVAYCAALAKCMLLHTLHCRLLHTLPFTRSGSWYRTRIRLPVTVPVTPQAPFLSAPASSRCRESVPRATLPPGRPSPPAPDTVSCSA